MKTAMYAAPVIALLAIAYLLGYEHGQNDIMAYAMDKIRELCS